MAGVQGCTADGSVVCVWSSSGQEVADQGFALVALSDTFIEHIKEVDVIRTINLPCSRYYLRLILAI